MPPVGFELGWRGKTPLHQPDCPNMFKLKCPLHVFKFIQFRFVNERNTFSFEAWCGTVGVHFFKQNFTLQSMPKKDTLSQPTKTFCLHLFAKCQLIDTFLNHFRQLAWGKYLFDSVCSNQSSCWNKLYKLTLKRLRLAVECHSPSLKNNDASFWTHNRAQFHKAAFKSRKYCLTTLCLAEMIRPQFHEAV